MSATTQPIIPTIVHGDIAKPDLLILLPPLVFIANGQIVDDLSYRIGPGKVISTGCNILHAGVVIYVVKA
jgi:hypothetical protein